MRSGSYGSVRIFYPRFNRAQLVARIAERLPQLQQELPLKRVVLFGSYAKGNSTVASDVDLLVVYEDPKREDDYKPVKSILDIPRLEPHVYSQSEYERSKTTIERMIAGGIVLVEA